MGKTRLWLLFVLAILGVMLFGCGGDDDSEESGGDADTDADTDTDTDTDTDADSDTEPVMPQGSVSGIAPASAFLARTVDVLISGSSTNWTDAAEIDFGDEAIKVTSTKVASPTALALTIEIGEDAELGAKDITVKQGEESYELKGAFKVLSPAELVVVGTQAQGSVLVCVASLKDLSMVFDTTTEGDGFFTPITYPNFAVEMPGNGLNSMVLSVAPYEVSFLISIDVDAATGPQDLNLLSGPLDFEDLFPLKSAFDVAAREPIELEFGKPMTGKIPDPAGTLLYHIPAASAASAMDVLFESSDLDSEPAPFFYVLDDMSFAEILYASAAPSFLQAKARDFYVVFTDEYSGYGYDFEITVRAAMLGTMHKDEEPNDDNTEATVIESLSSPYWVSEALLGSETDVDTYRFDAKAADVGKAFQISTYPGDAYCDPEIDVVDASEKSLGGPSSNVDYHEQFQSAPITKAGLYYIRVYWSTLEMTPYDETSPTYELLISLVTP